MLDVVALCRELDGLENIEQCAALFKRAIAPLGFTTYACGEIDLAWRDIAVFYIIDWPDAWRKFYLESGFLDDDPLIEALHARHDPFTWTELRADPRWPVGKTRVLALAAQSGWREGMVVPIRRGGTRRGLVSMAGGEPLTSGRERDGIAVVARHLMGRIREIGPRAFPVPPAGLTSRQLDVLRLVAIGHSDAEIAKTLGISRTTAHDHVDTARKRLHAATRAQAIARAVSLGIVTAD